MDSWQQVLIGDLGLVGERHDQKACFESRDILFQCLDDNNILEPYNYKCLSSYESWNKVCDPLWKKTQVLERRRLKRDHEIYTQERLATYNKKKNDEKFVYEKNFI